MALVGGVVSGSLGRISNQQSERDGGDMAKGDFKRRMEASQRQMLEWARGRNGADELSGACTNVAVILVIVDLFVRTTWMSVLALVLLGYSWFRITSKNVGARSQSRGRGARGQGIRSPELPLVRPARAHPPRQGQGAHHLPQVPRPIRGKGVRTYAHHVPCGWYRLGQVHRRSHASREGRLAV